MPEHRFFAGEGVLAVASPGDEIALGAEAAHRIARVLRLQQGEHIGIIGDGLAFDGILRQTGRQARVQLVSQLPPEPPRTFLTLYQALIRPNRFEWLIEKGTELGVNRFVPIMTEHTAVRATEIGSSRLERWRRIAVEATEQCGRMRPPDLAEPTAYLAALNASEGVRFLAWEGLRVETAAPGGREDKQSAGHVSLFIGPEGGWSAAEVEAARAAGVTLLSLGPTTLRAETAAIVAAARLLIP
jgi:16S rRNA (uracil1498-N3)-methyltransferase